MTKCITVSWSIKVFLLWVSNFIAFHVHTEWGFNYSRIRTRGRNLSPQFSLLYWFTTDRFMFFDDFFTPQQFLPLIFVFGEFCFLGDCWTYYTFWRRDTYSPSRQFHVVRIWCSQQITVTFLTNLVSVSSSQIYYHFSS